MNFQTNSSKTDILKILQIIFSFSQNFLRAEINPDYFEDKRFKTFEEFLFYSLEKSIIDYGVKVLIIDNITYLKTDNEKAKDAFTIDEIFKGFEKQVWFCQFWF